MIVDTPAQNELASARRECAELEAKLELRKIKFEIRKLKEDLETYNRIDAEEKEEEKE